eukprot:TRINITY_DN51867_c0_g1_i1.p1 TRINITY_DN51867_c0_g1~~TRINITY_DN51867_c0_g1_i1.p1  ORF type:complete len:514 (-),score=76.23 TRINITY_DN51867_c0_g1_i1:214-1755(-)
MEGSPRHSGKNERRFRSCRCGKEQSLRRYRGQSHRAITMALLAACSAAVRHSLFAIGRPVTCKHRSQSTLIDGAVRRVRTRCTSVDGVPKPSKSLTPLWTLKATQMLIFAANVCLARYITVYYDDLGLSRKIMGILLVIMPMMSFVGGLFWSSVVDKSGAYRKTLISTSLAGVAVVFAYLLPCVRSSLMLLVGITTLHGFLAAPAGPIVDGLCLKVLSEQEVTDEAYGDQRLWSAVGWGGMALFAGRLVDAFGTAAIFFSYAALVTLNVALIARYIPRMEKSAEIADGSSRLSTVEWLRTLCSFDSLWMLANLLVYGVLVALVENFLNVFIMQDFLKPSKVILGAATAIMCIFEIPVFKFIGRLWSRGRCSLLVVLATAEMIMALRCLLYAVLPREQPWLVLLVEPLHGFTFAAVWSATVEYARRLAPAGTEAKMQALISGLYFNIAMAGGSLVWGFLAQRPPAGIGFTRCFYLDAALITAWLSIWGAGFAIQRKLHQRRTCRTVRQLLLGKI